MIEKLKVGMADLNTTISPGILISLGLGSCVGIALYDDIAKIAGLAHIMLPSSLLIKNNENKAKFADTAIIQLVQDMIGLGAERRRLTAKIAGGAQMFSFNSQSSDLLKIGERNVLSSLSMLNKLKIPIIGRDTGGNFGRTVELYADSGRFLIRTIGHGIKEL